MAFEDDIHPLAYALVKAKETFEESLKEYEILNKQGALKKDNPLPNFLSGIIKNYGILENLPEPYRTGARLFLSMPASKSIDLLSLYMKMNGRNSDGSEKTTVDLLKDIASYAMKFAVGNNMLGEK